ncbi:MAG: hypothetical protein LBR79_05230 [Oscillospiraceae bacterium]|nr:hypothetical protein [Oscillospiraceae bacterium]
MKGRKRHIVTDITGNILGAHIHAANIHDTKGGCTVLSSFLIYTLCLSVCENTILI